LIALRGLDLLRVNILNVAGCGGPVVVQYLFASVQSPAKSGG